MVPLGDTQCVNKEIYIDRSQWVNYNSGTLIKLCVYFNLIPMLTSAREETDVNKVLPIWIICGIIVNMHLKTMAFPGSIWISGARNLEIISSWESKGHLRIMAEPWGAEPRYMWWEWHEIISTWESKGCVRKVYEPLGAEPRYMCWEWHIILR